MPSRCFDLDLGREIAKVTHGFMKEIGISKYKSLVWALIPGGSNEKSAGYTHVIPCIPPIFEFRTISFIISLRDFSAPSPTVTPGWLETTKKSIRINWFPLHMPLRDGAARICPDLGPFPSQTIRPATDVDDDAVDDVDDVGR